MDNIDDIKKREAMIEMLQALDVALSVRMQRWAEEANTIPRVVLSPRQANKNKARVLECKTRVDELQEIRKLVTGTIETCKEQNAGPPPAEVIQ